MLYLLAIVGPTLALLFLGLQPVRRQRQAVASLTASKLRLSGERLAAEVERRVSQLAEVLSYRFRRRKGAATSNETEKLLYTHLGRF
ncbi:MAG: hypothetical protein WEF99_18400 [Thermoanaerobaculia bacterium]